MIFLVTLTLALSAYFLHADTSGLTKVADVQMSNVMWLDREPTDCGGVVPSFAYVIHGCASTSPYTLRENTCIMEMPKDAPDRTIAHEVKHCFGWVDTER